jgi:hypothetical protein
MDGDEEKPVRLLQEPLLPDLLDNLRKASNSSRERHYDEETKRRRTRMSSGSCRLSARLAIPISFTVACKRSVKGLGDLFSVGVHADQTSVLLAVCTLHTTKGTCRLRSSK